MQKWTLEIEHLEKLVVDSQRTVQEYHFLKIRRNNLYHRPFHGKYIFSTKPYHVWMVNARLNFLTILDPACV